DSRIHILGVAYKRGVSDCRESPALAVMKLLAERGAKLSYSDPYVPEGRGEWLDLTSEAPRDGALAVLNLLAERGAKLSYSAPYVPEVREEGLDLTSQAPRDVVTGCDCVVI